MRQPVERTPDGIVDRIQFLVLRRNLKLAELARHLNLSENVFSQRLGRRSLNEFMPRIAAFLGVPPSALVDEKLSNEKVLSLCRGAGGAEEFDVSGAKLGRIAFDIEAGFGRGKWAVISRAVPYRPGDTVAYHTDAGYVVRRLSEGSERQVVLLHPHAQTQTEIKSKDWAGKNLWRVLAICDMT